MVEVAVVNGKEEVIYTPEEKERALLHFVTSTEDPIYACKNIPKELFSAMTSYFSRNPRDLREHLFDAIIGRIRGFELPAEQGAENLRGLIEGQHIFLEDYLMPGIEKAQKFNRLWLGKFSHKSIANVASGIPIVMTNISQLVARQVAYDQLTFFIEQSTRFCKFDSGIYYEDPDIMNSEFAGLYTETIDSLIDSYSRLFGFGEEYYTKKIPFDDWLESQSDKIKEKTEKSQKRGYNTFIKGRIFDDIRFLLPQAILTNLSSTINARSLEFDIATWKGHPLHEIGQAAELLEKHGKQIVPSLLISTDKNPYYADKYREYNGDFAVDQEIKPTRKHVNIISYDPELLDKFIALELKRCNTGTFEPFLEIAQDMALEQKIDMVGRMVAKRRVSDEWISVGETADLQKLLIEIVTDVGATRDLRRHQKPDRDESKYTLDNGYTIPPAVEDGYGGEALEIFVNAVQKAHSAEKKIREKFPHQAQYVIPMACNHSFIISLGIDQLQYFINQRSTPLGNWSYRKDMYNLLEEVLILYPWLVGYEKYPENTSVIDAYKNSPFIKNLERAVFNFKQETGEEFNELMPHPALVRLKF